MNRRVLVVGYYYPDLNMGGVRLRRICRMLPRHGWDPVVLTQPLTRPAVDVTPPPGVSLEEVAATDLTRIYRQVRGLLGGRKKEGSQGPAGKAPQVQNIDFTSKINRWLMIPDKQMPWLRPAVRKGKELLGRHSFSAIFATLDPRTSLLVAARLSRETGVPCVLEYRDLWVGNPYYHLTQPTVIHRWMHARLERNALRQAARVSAVCRGIGDYLTQAHGSILRAPVDLNYNFYDPEEYPAPSPRSAPSPFVISYTGNMYASRTPHRFFEGMRAFIDRHQIAPTQFRFRWAGGVSGVRGLSEILDQTGVTPYMDFLGQLPHQAALQSLVDSDAALLLQAPGDSIHIPGKLFEALGARVPMLAISEPCETTEIIRACRAGVVSSYETQSVAQAMEALYERWRQGLPWAFDESRLAEYSASATIEKLARVLDAAAQTAPSPT